MDLKQITSELAKMKMEDFKNLAAKNVSLDSEISESKAQNLKIIGFSSSEDCGAFSLPRGANAQVDGSHILLCSADFITPIVDDPYTFGQIAAANSLSDIFAMGGRAISALNLFMWDRKNVDKNAASEILKGGLSKILECGAQLLGGHTTSDSELKYGLSVNGVVEKSKVWRNNTAQIGDALVLSKPLGSGIISTALKAREISNHKQMIENLTLLNCYAAQIAQSYEIHACTDITGFGLIGHLLEMCALDSEISESKAVSNLDSKPSANVGALLDCSSIVFYEQVLQIARNGIVPSGTYTNFENYKKFVRVIKDLDDEILFYDVQTSGGLLFALPKVQAQSLLDDLHRFGMHNAAIIGEIVPLDSEKVITLG